MRARLTAEQAEEKIERLETQLAVLEHALYLALVAPCEIYLRLDPCPAMRLADDVARFLRDDAVLARPPSLWYRVQKTVRRHREIGQGPLCGRHADAGLDFRAVRLAGAKHGSARCALI